MKNNLKNFFSMSFRFLSVFSFICVFYFLLKKNVSYVYVYIFLGILFQLISSLIVKLVPEEEEEGD